MVLSELALWTIILLELTCLFAYFLKGFSGFGPALVFIPVVAYLLDPKLALASSAFLDFLVGIAMLLTFKYSKTDWLLIAKICSMMVVGIVLGGLIVSMMPVNTILLVIAILVLLVGLNMLIFSRTAPTGVKIKHPVLLYFMSFLSGLAGGIAGIAGPFIIMVLKPNMDKSSFRRILTAVFVVGGFVRLIVYSSVEIFSKAVFTFSLLTAPAIIIGLLIGYYYHRTVNETWFSRIVGFILIAISARILWSQW
ncbi:MAG: sulfite exporter TauE/SafE family protein [Candidatus Zixiibacteriota bacterium]